MSIKGVFLRAVKAAAFSLAVCVLASGCGGGKNNPVNTDPVLDGDLVGDWLVYDGANKKGYITLKSNGELREGVLRKAGAFWVEGLYEGAAKWSASRARRELYVASALWKDTMKYDLSGNSFSTTSCYENSGRNPVCRGSGEIKRTVLADLRKSLGTVYVNDTNLYMSKAHRDLMWYSQDDVIDFDAVYFNKEGGRIGYSRDGVWYTSGSSLFLLDAAYDCGGIDDDCAAVILSAVELSYSVSVSAGSPASLTLSGGVFGSGDAWLPASYDERAGYGSAKRRGDAVAGKRAFSPLAVLTGRE